MCISSIYTGCIRGFPCGTQITAPTFGPYPPTLESKISGNIGWIIFWSKIPSRYASKPLGKIERIEKTHFKSVLKNSFKTFLPGNDYGGGPGFFKSNLSSTLLRAYRAVRSDTPSGQTTDVQNRSVYEVCIHLSASFDTWFTAARGDTEE